MRHTKAVLGIAIAISLAGCVTRGKQQVVKATQPPPNPVVAPPPAQANTRLSIPQTNVELPAPQPVDPEALATALPEEPAETPPAPKPARRRVGPAGPQAKPEPPAQVAQPAPAVAEPERPAIGEIVPPDEQKRLQDSAQARKRTIRQLVEQAQGRRLSKQETNLITRIEQFVKLSEEAEGAGNMRQADELADRGLILARELQSGR